MNNSNSNSALNYPILIAALIGLTACSNDDIEPFSLDVSVTDDEPQWAEAAIDPFFQQYLGTWKSPCLFVPDRLTGPTSGDYVVYDLSFTETRTTWAHQDYLDENCLEMWPYGSGSVETEFVFSTRMVSESGLDVAVFPRDDGISIVEAVNGDSTPNDDSSSDASVGIIGSSVPVLDIIHLSSSGELFLGDQSPAQNDDTAPTRLDLNNAWTSQNNTQVSNE